MCAVEVFSDWRASAFYLLTRFSGLDTVSAAVGTAAALGGLTLLAVTHRSPGSFAFTRLFQGKTLLLAVWTPLFTVVSIDFFRAPTRSEVRANGWFLGALAISGLGLSSTSMVFLPALASVLAAAGLASGWVQGRKSCRVLSYFCTLFYLGIGIVYTYRYAASNLALQQGSVCG